MKGKENVCVTNFTSCILLENQVQCCCVFLYLQILAAAITSLQCIFPVFFCSFSSISYIYMYIEILKTYLQKSLCQQGVYSLVPVTRKGQKRHPHPQLYQLMSFYTSLLRWPKGHTAIYNSHIWYFAIWFIT